MPRFRLLAGSHSQLVQVKGRNKPRQEHFSKGDVIEDETDLVARFGSTKFQRVYDEEPSEPVKSTKRKSKLEKSNEGVDSIEDDAGFESKDPSASDQTPDSDVKDPSKEAEPQSVSPKTKKKVVKKKVKKSAKKEDD